MSDNALKTIRQMCDDFDVTPRTLRFYEAKELLSPIRQGTRRLFTRRDRVRLKLILRGKRYGFSLDEIGQFLDMYETGKQQAGQIARVQEMATRRLADMERERADLDAAIRDLRQELAESGKRFAGVHDEATAG
ncbi:MAG: MerR family transcriptional regulator [Tropicimonas sp.]|uniref:MerR family transcriptional regulator n=1 Tax=Tropicimonas sp. TaxID=2067044 RepID=UPI003A83EF6D